MMTTKEQERKALEQIRQIVEALGENSYIGTAFEGCFEIAEDNINNDWACSMKQTADYWQKKAEAEFKRAEQKDHVIVDLRQQQAKAKKPSFTEAQLRNVHEYVLQQQERDSQQAAAAAATIVELADHPEDIAFQQAVKNHRDYSSRMHQDIGIANIVNNVLKNY